MNERLEEQASANAPGAVDGGPADEWSPPVIEPSRGALRTFVREHRALVGLLFAAVLVTAFVIAVLPQITSIGSTLKRVGHGNHLWLLAGVGLEAISLGGYILLFRTVFACAGSRIGWRASYEITMAGTVATKLFAAAGAGGIALTAWALRSAGLSPSAIARRLAGFEVILYLLFMLTLIVVGLGLGLGVFGSGAPWALSYLPAVFGGGVIVLALLAALLPAAFAWLLPRLARHSRRIARVADHVATVPETLRGGIATATELIGDREAGTLGGVVYWAFDIAALWVSFKAFGIGVSVPVVIMGYFIGQLANAIPLPGGIGGVEGGMIGCFIGLGVSAGGAVVGVFAYRAISFWLPTLPGAVAYLQLRRRVGRWRESRAAG